MLSVQKVGEEGTNKWVMSNRKKKTKTRIKMNTTGAKKKGGEF